MKDTTDTSITGKRERIYRLHQNSKTFILLRMATRLQHILYYNRKTNCTHKGTTDYYKICFTSKRYKGPVQKPAHHCQLRGIKAMYEGLTGPQSPC